MNIDTSSSSASGMSSVQTQSRSSSASKSSNEEQSFDKELKNVSGKADENKVEAKDSDTKEPESKETVKKEEGSVSKNDKTTNKDDNSEHNLNKDIVPGFALDGAIDFTDFKYHNQSQSLLTKNIQDLINTKGLMVSRSSDSDTLKASIDYNSMSMSDGDALFFSDLVKNTDMSMQSIATQIQQQAEMNVQAAEKTAKVSTILMDKLNEAVKTNQPFRIDFDKGISVIIRVDKDGSITANFIPGDKAVEQYLKNNISFLKQRFDEQDLKYSDLSYSQNRQQQQEEQRRKNKENGHE